MITERIFDWAQRTPEKTAVIYNEQAWSYRSFAAQIAMARGYFLRRNYAGPGHAVLAIHDQLDFWILSLALRSLGLTSIAVGGEAMVGELPLPDIRCMVTRPEEVWPDLASLCKARSALNQALKAYPRTNIRHVAALPRNQMGKVMRQAVRDQVTASLSSLT